ncbi:MAG: cyclase family protein [Acidobacteria bacterium]|nr:cyclase family protein [Acidobacteriota bacterium]
MTTFLPSADAAPERRFTADVKRPVGASRVVAGFQDQAVLVQLPDFPSGDGVFKLNSIILPENLGTSVDSAGHFVPMTPEVPAADRRGLSELTVEDLTGPVVFIDISARVEAELKKNNGSPGPPAVTNFGEASPNVVTAADIDAIADRLANRSFVIAHTGWSRFWGMSGPGFEGPYVNGFNFPGFSRAAIARLIEIETARNIRINGVGADNIAADVGENANAPKFGPGAFPIHARGLQRGWKLLENLATTAELGRGRCTLYVGALNHVGGVASWARGVRQLRELIVQGHWLLEAPSQPFSPAAPVVSVERLPPERR